MSAGIRLDRLLANLGYGTRRDIAAMARAGRITLDGKILDAADSKVCDAEAPRIRISDCEIDPPHGIVLMMHKPVGATCSHTEAGTLVYDLLPDRWRKRTPPISSIGRLDKETSGLLLLTDDGTLLHKIIAPKSRLPKRYRAHLARPLRGDEVELFATGTMMLTGESKPLLPAILKVFDPTIAEVIITEGRYHQVRRMFAAVGNHVEALHRTAVGGLTLSDGLEPGAYDILAPEGVATIFSPQAEDALSAASL